MTEEFFECSEYRIKTDFNSRLEKGFSSLQDCYYLDEEHVSVEIAISRVNLINNIFNFDDYLDFNPSPHLSDLF